jgi:hypothetical protein
MSAARIQKWALAAGALLIVLSAAARGLQPSEPSPPGRAAPKAGPAEARPSEARETPVATASSAPAVPPSDGEVLKGGPCDLKTLVKELRKGRASPAYQRYVREQMRGFLESLPAEPLWSQLVAERDPEVLGLLAEAWVKRYTRDRNPRVLERLVNHLQGEREPALRASMVRAFRHTGEPSTELLGRSVLKGRDVYAAWVKDQAPEVRQAVVENAREEAARNFGRFQGVAEKAVALAVEATDPKVKAGLLTASSLEAVRAPAVAQVRELLEKGEAPEVRAAAAKALGTVPVAQAGVSMQALSGRYAAESNRQVRSAILESIARLGLGKAVAVLQKLRGVDASMQSEVDHWLTLLASNPQTWALLEKDRRVSQNRPP